MKSEGDKNMKSSKVKHFLTTSDVSQLLGVSTGTVQKMVDKKILESYSTSGGHRRVSLSSVKRYMAELDPKFSFLIRDTSDYGNAQISMDDRQLFFVVNDFAAIENYASISCSNINILSKPSDLFSLFFQRGVIVIDASVTWLDWIDGVCKLYQMTEYYDPEILVFNSDLIPDERKKDIPSGPIFFEGNLAIDFVRGYFAMKGRRSPDKNVNSMI